MANLREKKIKKNWLCALIILTSWALFIYVISLFDLPSVLADQAKKNIYIFSVISQPITLLAWAYILYRCAYKKPGRKFLAFYLVITSIIFIYMIPYQLNLFSFAPRVIHFNILVDNSIFLLNLAINIVFFIFSIKLLKLNIETENRLDNISKGDSTLTPDQLLNSNTLKKKNSFVNNLSITASWGLIALALFIKIYTTISLYAGSWNIAYMIGHTVGYLGLPLIISLIIWRYVFKKRKNYLLGCCSIVLFLSSLISLQGYRTELSLKNDIQQELTNILLSPPDDSSETPNNSYPTAKYGELAPVLSFINIEVTSEKRVINKIISEMGIADNTFSCIDDFVDPEIVAKVRSLDIDILNNLEEIESKMIKRFRNRPDEIEKLKISEPVKKVVLKGYFDASKEAETKINNLFNALKNLLIEKVSFYNFLLEKQGLYTIDEETNCMFILKKEDKIQYNQYLENLEYYKNEILKISEEEVQDIQNKFSCHH